MLNLFYSEKSLKEQMQKLNHVFLIAGNSSGENVGFVSYSLINEDETAKKFRLHKIYVLPSEQGSGLGKKLIDEIFFRMRSMAENKKSLSLELNVNRYNNARFFYEKLGFQITREEDIDIGNGFFMNDFVLEMAIKS